MAAFRRASAFCIHAATGGVGLAAISVASKHGAEVYATAGSPEKRAYLHALGIEHVFDSRSLDFADDVMAATDGYGVDLVLNSLPGPFLEKGLSLLASGGRFLEIGKRDIYADTPIGLHVLRKNASFFAIDLARLAAERPDSLRREWKACSPTSTAAVLAPLPVEDFPVAHVAEAFRHMAKARHIGKIVVTYGPKRRRRWSKPAAAAAKVVHADAAYLVTGGLRGFGLAVAQWLVENGARHLVLVSRTGAVTPEAVRCRRGDAGTRRRDCAAGGRCRDLRRHACCDRSACKTLGVPLRGIIHAAGVIDDALVPQLELDKIRRVFEPKVLGAWHLHDLTRDARSTSSSASRRSPPISARSVRRIMPAPIARSRPSPSSAALGACRGCRSPGAPSAISGYLAHHAEVARYLSQTGVNQIPIRERARRPRHAAGRDCSKVVFADLRWPLLARANPALANCTRIADLVGSDPNENKSGQFLRTKLPGDAGAEPSA